MTLTTFQTFLLVVAGLTGCLNTGLQILRSRARRRESAERRLEIADQRALQTWLYEHGKREEEASRALPGAVADAVLNATPPFGTSNVR